jgi:hypothetical protein
LFTTALMAVSLKFRRLKVSATHLELHNHYHPPSPNSQSTP